MVSFQFAKCQLKSPVLTSIGDIGVGHGGPPLMNRAMVGQRKASGLTASLRPWGRWGPALRGTSREHALVILVSYCFGIPSRHLSITFSIFQGHSSQNFDRSIARACDSMCMFRERLPYPPHPSSTSLLKS